MPHPDVASNGPSVPRPRPRALIALVGLTLACLVAGTAAHAAEPPIAGLEVFSRVSRQGRDLRTSMRQNLESALKRVEWSRSSDRGPFVLTTSLVRLDTSTSEGTTRVSCTVSMTIRERKRGNIRAIVEGRGRTESAPSAATLAEEEALGAAIRGAVKGLPEAIRRSR
ncbi:MAG TPA: hypothetical protein PLI95_02835 [Polyangiaceae bacterium]|nr:hypothetical protein [Polyangiaceae bacterium]